MATEQVSPFHGDREMKTPKTSFAPSSGAWDWLAMKSRNSSSRTFCRWTALQMSGSRNLQRQRGRIGTQFIDAKKTMEEYEEEIT